MLEATYGIGKDSEIEIPREEIDPSDQVEWTWDESNDKDFVVLLNNNRDVTFHRDMSGGTAVVSMKVIIKDIWNKPAVRLRQEKASVYCFFRALFLLLTKHKTHFMSSSHCLVLAGVTK
ncbi:hypothetical protein TNIN_83401 [Trichonephila inaurata madagascariensis]|uniref:Uncharacterized protein n=1 Tax=Trichonephila inaurata madagascariensis TaxID=2747483 RepID=A0A8X6Y6N8_9ARAC|nr:hypothetical protein TNIN_83401 [Trichonephila inaurata madagascariensis]